MPTIFDLEVGNAVAVDVAADDRDVVGGASLVEGLVTKLALLARESFRADKPEPLVARAAGVGVDPREIDVVQSRLEIGDDVAGAGPDRRFIESVEIEHVTAGAAGQCVAAEAAGEPSLPPPPTQRIGASIAGKGIGERRADDVLDADQPIARPL